MVDGITFDSELESRHYELLRDCEDVDIVKRQKRFVLYKKQERVRLPDMKEVSLREIVYTPDFIITFKGLDKPIAVESKGYARPAYRLRQRLWEHLYGDEYHFMEVGKGEMKGKLKELREKVNKCQKKKKAN